MKAQTFIDEAAAIQRELHLLDLLREETDGTETFISRAGSYLSGRPFVWSGDAARAFRFRDREQAEELIEKFPVVLKGAHVGQFHPRAGEARTPEVQEVAG